jgi:hypothetical protein
VAGAIGVVNDLEVRLPGIDERPDPEIARDAIARIKSELPFSWEKIRVVVKNGWLTLEGEVEWNYQRQRAEEAVRRVRGLKGVTNSIEVKPRGSIATSSGAGCQPHHGRDNRERGDPEGHRAIMGRAPGGGKSCLGGAGRSEGRQSDHR